MAEVQLLVGGVVVLQALGVQLVLRVDFYSELDNVLTFDISHGTHTHTHFYVYLRQGSFMVTEQMGIVQLPAMADWARYLGLREPGWWW